MNKYKSYIKTKQEQVWEILDKQGYILDNQSAKIFGEYKLYCVSEHIRKWKKYQADKKFMANQKVLGLEKGYRCHVVKTENGYYKIGKEYWNELLSNTQ